MSMRTNRPRAVLICTPERGLLFMHTRQVAGKMSLGMGSLVSYACVLVCHTVSYLSHHFGVCHMSYMSLIQVLYST